MASRRTNTEPDLRPPRALAAGPQATPLGHVGLTVPDLEGAVRWYSTVFGWELLMGPVDLDTDDPRVADQLRDVFGAPQVAFRQAHMLAGPGVAIELFEFSTTRRTCGNARIDYWNPGLFHFCVVEPAIEELATRIERAGGARRTRIREIFPGEPYRFCYCEDPFGTVIEIATHPHAEAFGGRGRY
jgi:catechol 2,3-dioxygenase-like lactoylglutathione lyase family enzyme